MAKIINVANALIIFTNAVKSRFALLKQINRIPMPETNNPVRPKIVATTPIVAK